MARQTKIKITKDDYYELEVWKNKTPEVSISLGIIDEFKKRNEIVFSLNNEDLDLLINALIELRYE